MAEEETTDEDFVVDASDNPYGAPEAPVRASSDDLNVSGNSAAYLGPGMGVREIVDAIVTICRECADSGVCPAVVSLVGLFAVVGFVPTLYVYYTVPPGGADLIAQSLLGILALFACAYHCLMMGLTQPIRRIYLEGKGEVATWMSAMRPAISNVVPVCGRTLLHLAIFGVVVGVIRAVGSGGVVLIPLAFVVLAEAPAGLYITVIRDTPGDLKEGWKMFGRRWRELLTGYLFTGVFLSGVVLFGFALIALLLFFLPDPFSVLFGFTILVLIVSPTTALLFSALFLRLEVTERHQADPPDIWRRLGTAVVE